MICTSPSSRASISLPSPKSCEFENTWTSTLPGSAASASSLNLSAPWPLGVFSATTWLNFTMMGWSASAADEKASARQTPSTLTAGIRIFIARSPYLWWYGNQMQDNSRTGSASLDGTPDIGDQLRTDQPFHLDTHGGQGLFPCPALRVREDMNLCFPRSPDRRQGPFVFFPADRGGITRRLCDGLFQRFADIGRQPFPEFPVDDHVITQVTVIGHGEMGLHVLHVLGVEIRRRVLGAVHHAGFQRGIHFTEPHGHRLGAQSPHLRVQHPRGLDAHAQARQVGRHVQRPIGREGLEPVIPESQADDALDPQ